MSTEVEIQEEKEKPNGRFRIHNVRFYNISPRAIQCLAYNKMVNKLALSRSDGTIEVWDMQYAPYLERVITSTPGKSVEGLAWACKRLFSVGITGELVEWDLRTLEARRVKLMTGNASWCIDINHERINLAVGTEGGYINIISIEDDDMLYNTLFDKQEGRILCCKYDATGDYLVTGSEGAIRIWNTHTGHAINRINVARGNNSQLIVWSLQVLRDFSIVCGDSAGYVSVWDGNTASQLEDFKVLNADVLTVAVNEEENLLMCSGIEPVIRIFARTQIKREEIIFNRWVKFLQRSIHSHDVKSLLCVDDRIISGGLDGYLMISSASKTRSDTLKYLPFLQDPCITHSAKENFILMRFSNYLELWMLGSAKKEFAKAEETFTDTSKPKICDLEKMPKKLLILKSNNESYVVCAAISPDGHWICYSTQHEIRHFRFRPATNTTDAVLKHIKKVPKRFEPASQLTFTSDSERLLLVQPHNKRLAIFIITEVQLVLLQSIQYGKYIKDRVSHLKISHCGTYIVLAGADHKIVIWSLNAEQYYDYYLSLPCYTAATTALALHVDRPLLVAAFSDGKIFEYDLDDMSFTCSSNEPHVANSTTHYIKNIVLDPKNPDIFILHNDQFLYVLEKITKSQLYEKSKQNSAGGGTSLKRSKPTAEEDKVKTLHLKLKLDYEHLMHLDRLNDGEMLAVNVNSAMLMEHLPSAYVQKKFGIS